MKPYTYLIRVKLQGHKLYGKCYYGSRFQNVRFNRTAEEDLMVVYHTSCKEIKQLIKEYGLDAVEWEVRRKFETPASAVEWERKVLTRAKVLQHQDKWMNKNIAGHILATPESCKKISDFHKGKPKTEEHRQKIGNANKGKPKEYTKTTEYRANMSEKLSGKNNPMYGPCSAERAANISAAKKGKPNGCAGRVRSEESKQKQREKMLGRQLTPDQLARSIAGRIGLKQSEETKRKRSESLKGIVRGPMPDSEKLKRSNALIGKPKSNETTAKKAETLKQLAAEGLHHSQIVLTCPHCGTQMKKLLFARWHGDNCKQRRI